MLYRLLRDDGEIECEADARDDHHALRELGRKLEKTLSFIGPAGPTYTTYMLQCVETNQVHWRPHFSKAVYEIDPQSN